MTPQPTPDRRRNSPSRRALGSFETALQLTGEPAPFNVAIVLRLRSGPPTELLESCLATLQDHHPLLRSRIVQSGERYWFETGNTPAVPLRLVARDDEETWRGVVEDELNRHLDVTRGPALRCTHLPSAASGGDSEIVLTLNHAIIDASSSITLLGQLLSLCDPAGEALGRDEPAPGPPVESLFPPPFRGLGGGARLLGFAARQTADEIQFRLRSRTSQQPSVHEQARCRILPLQLAEDATAGLVRSTRRERVTLNGACGAAMLLAVHRHLYGGEAVTMRHFSFVDLRPRLRPAVSAGSLGCHISMLRHGIEMRPGVGFWPLAQAVTTKVTDSLRRGDPFSAVRLGPRMMRSILAQRRFRMGTTAVSYIGVRRLQARYGSTRVLGLHGFVSSIPLGPQYTAQVRIFARRLCWDIVYLDRDLDASLAQRIASEITATLRRAAGKD